MAEYDIDALLDAAYKKKDEKEGEKPADEHKGSKRSNESDDKNDDRSKRRRSRSRSPHSRDKRRSRSPHGRDRRRDRHGRRSRSRSPRDRRSDKERERERKEEERQRQREKEALLDPLERLQIEAERDARTVFVTNMPIKADEDDISRFFAERAGKVRDIRLIMDKNSRKSKGFGYVEFVDKSSVPAAMTLSGQPFMNSIISVKVTQSEKNRVQTQNTTTYITPSRVYVGSLHLNLTEADIKEKFSEYGTVEFVDLHIDPQTNRSKGFAFIQYKKPEDAKRALAKANGMELGGRVIKVGLVNETVSTIIAKNGGLDLDDDGISLNVHSRAVLMAKLQKSTSGTQSTAPPAPAPVAAPPVKVASSTCVQLKNMFDPELESGENWDKEIAEDVKSECSRFGTIYHIYVDKNSEGHVYLRFSSVPAATNAINALNGRWFAKKQIVAEYFPENTYNNRFPISNPNARE